MGTEIARVVAGAIDQSGLAAAQKLHSHDVQARMRGDPAIVTDLALAIQDRHLEPGIVRAISGCPNDRPDPAFREVHEKRRRSLDKSGSKPMRRIDLSVEAVAGGPLVDRG